MEQENQPLEPKPDLPEPAPLPGPPPAAAAVEIVEPEPAPKPELEPEPARVDVPLPKPKAKKKPAKKKAFTKTARVTKGADGVWRSYYKGRGARHDPALHEPEGPNGEPPPLTPGGSFRRMPKALRKFSGREPTPKAPAPTPKPQGPSTTPGPEAPSGPSPQEPASGKFPEYSPLVEKFREREGAAPADLKPPPAPGQGPAALKIPLAEYAIDALMTTGEALGGPPAPQAVKGAPFEPAQLRQLMIDALNESLPALGNVNAGPKTRLALGASAYLALCYTRPEFRKNVEPIKQTIGQRLGAAWYKAKTGVGNWLAARKKRKEEREKQHE